MISKTRPPRVHWDAVNGWVVDTQIALTRQQLFAVVAHTKKIQHERIRAMPAGDRREQAVAAIKNLTPATLKVKLLPQSGYSDGERELFLHRG